MHPISRFSTPLCIAITLLSGAFQVQAENPTLTIHAVNYPPYEIEQPTADGLRGFDVEVATAAFERVGYALNVEFLPWKRIIAMARTGETLAVLSCGVAKDRNQYINYSDPISTTSRTYAAPLDYDGKKPQTIGDGKGAKVVSVSGYILTKELDAAGVDYFPATSDETALNILLKRDYDFFYTNREYIKYIAATLNMKGQFQYFDTKKPSLLHLCFSRKWPESDKLHKLFNKGLADIRADGSYDAIHAKYQ